MLGASQAVLLSCAASLNQSYADTVRSLSPVAYWRLDESDGTTIIDETEIIQNSTYFGSIEFGLEPIVSGSTGTSIGFNGTNAYGKIPHRAKFATPEGTVVFAVQADSISGQHMLLAKDDGSKPIGGLTVDITDGRLRAYFRDGARAAVWLPDPGGAADIQANVAHHVALTWGSRGAELWLDGALVASNAGLAVGLASNTVDLLIAAYPGPVAFGDVVMDEIAWFDRQLNAVQIRSLAKPHTIAHAGPAGVGIQLPLFGYQSISDPVPPGAVWWDPTNGSDSHDGSSKALAKQTFAAAEALVAAGGTIVAAGGAAGSTTYHSVPSTIAPTKSGSSGSYITLMGEPGTYVVLCRQGEFIGGLDGSWSYTTLDSSKKIYRTPDLGISDGATDVTNPTSVSNVTNGITGLLVIPNGPLGRPYVMRMPFYNATDIEASATGANAGQEIQFGGYGGPGVRFDGAGHVVIRMQKPCPAYTGTDWPTDGRFGGLINSSGSWAEPATENPHDYQIHLSRFDSTGQYATAGNWDLFTFNNVSYWKLRGINGALMNRTVYFNNSHDNWFDYCTFYPHWTNQHDDNATPNNKWTHCQMFTGDTRHLSWQDYKTGGRLYQHMRSTLAYYGTGDSQLAKSLLFQDCVCWGFFDGMLTYHDIDGYITFDHCALMHFVDDGIQQRRSDGRTAFEIKYCFSFGGSFFSGDSDDPMSGPEWLVHHNVVYEPLPMLWSACGNTSDFEGLQLGYQKMVTEHSAGWNGPVKAKKLCYNTFIYAPDTRDRHVSITLAPSTIGQSLPSGVAHEAYNNIAMVYEPWDRRPHGTVGGDGCNNAMCCQQSGAGYHRYDYNCYWRDVVGGPTSPIFYNVQDYVSGGRVNTASYNALADFRASAHKTTSRSMYTDGTDGHEEHGVEVDPGFVDIANLDFRPTHPSVTSGAKDVTALIGGSFENWKGALDPAGDGSEVGPRFS